MQNRLRYTILTCTLLFTTLFAQQKVNLDTTTIDGQKFYIYSVNQSEGFFAISKQFHVTQAEIEQYNPETKNGLKKGQRILIPVKDVSTSNEPSNKNETSFTHTVQTGETLAEIAEMYHVTPSDIICINPNLKKILVTGQAILIPQAAQLYQTSEQDIYHTIEPHETLYSLARKYNCSIEQIITLNPGLSSQNFQTGKVVRIHPSQSENNVNTTNVVKTKKYYVQSKETLYSLSKKLNISLATLLELNPGVTKIKVGQALFIPDNADTSSQIADESVESTKIIDRIQAGNASKTKRNFSVGIILPFQLNSDLNSQKQNRYLEFYEGFLLAVDSVRRQNTSIDLYVYDSETEEINSILNKTELQNCDLIVGPGVNNQNELVAAFAKKHQINMINPFSFDADLTINNPYLFQLNTPNSYLYAESSNEFVSIFKNQEVVFLNDLEQTPDKKDFIEYLQHTLQSEGVKYHTFNYKTPEEIAQVDSIFELKGEVVFVPLSSKKEVLSKILPNLHILKRANEELSISLFGYPEWQMYTNEFMDYYYELNTYIYTRIYMNPFASDTKDFYEKFRYWYHKDLLPIYPRYGVLGFDTGLFFLNAVKQYGKNFDLHIDMIPAHSIQTAMCFRRINNWSGFINRCIYFVNFRPNATIEKIEVK